MNLEAIMQRVRYTISVSDNQCYESGSIIGLGDYEYKSVALLEASPANGYTFEKWIIDGNEFYDAIHKLEVLKNTQVQALFTNPLSIESSNNDQIVVYPLVTNDVINIKGAKDKRAIISNISGKIIKNDFIDEHEIIDLSNYSSGVYLLEIIDNDSICKNYKIIRK